MRGYKEEKKHFEHVMVIDDDEIDNLINERLITTFGFSEKVSVKTTATSSIRFLEELILKNEFLPQVIFLDYFMPEIDGIGFLQMLEVLEGKYPGKLEKVQVVVLTALKNPEKRKRMQNFEKVVTVISKPLNKKALDYALLHCSYHTEKLQPR